MSHFLDLADLQGEDLRHLLDAGAARKAARAGLPKGAVDADAPLARAASISAGGTAKLSGTAKANSKSNKAAA